MKKKIFAVLVSTMMVAAMLVGCGEAAAPATTEEAPAVEATEEVATEEDGAMCSDETFATLQENYALTQEAYDAVVEFYASDEVAQSDEIESLLVEAEDVLAQMGEISQDQITEEDAVTLNDAMVTLIDALGMIVDGMEPAADADVADDVCSDETFAALQENFAVLSADYDLVVEYYASDAVEADAEIEAILEEAAAEIDALSEISQEELTEADAVEVNDYIIALDEALAVVVEAM